MIRSRLRHVGFGLGTPDAPEFSAILLVTALELAIEDLDGNVLLVAQPLLHRALDQGIERPEFVLRERSELFFKARQLVPVDYSHGAGRKGQNPNTGHDHEAGLAPNIFSPRNHNFPRSGATQVPNVIGFVPISDVHQEPA